MTITDELMRAIKEKRPIVYTYEKAGSAIGERQGNPHIIYLSSKKRVGLLGIHKTGGVQTKPNQPLLGWRVYELKYLKILRVEDSHFQVDRSIFKPHSKLYVNKICSVE